MISTHTPLARRDASVSITYDNGAISTHTPLARRDGKAPECHTDMKNFYSHASREA